MFRTAVRRRIMEQAMDSSQSTGRRPSLADVPDGQALTMEDERSQHRDALSSFRFSRRFASFTHRGQFALQHDQTAQTVL
jgi:hypothetical protein